MKIASRHSFDMPFSGQTSSSGAKVKLLGLLLLSLFLSGCAMVGPDFTRPEAPISDSWGTAAEESLKAISEQHEEWWLVFNDPVLDSLIREAYQQNLDLQIIGLRILEARAQLGIATGNLYPQQQQASVGAAAVGGSKNAANTVGGDFRYKDLTTGIDAAWELDFWGKFRRGVESADAQYLASIANYDDVMVTLTAEVARVYIQIRTFEDRIRLARDSAAIQERSLEIAKNRFEGGLVTELDITQAQSLLSNTLAAIPRLLKDYRQTQNALSVLLGLPPTDLSDQLNQEGSKQIPQVPAEVAVGVPADLLRRRPDVRRAELQAAAQSALIGVAKADLLPHFTLIGSIGLHASKSPLTQKGGSDFGDLFSSDSVTYFAGPSVTWDFLNYGRIKNQVRVQDARLQQLIINYQNTVLNASREVEDAMIGFIEDQVQARYLADAVAASKRSVELSSLQYGEGLTDYLRVLEALRRLSVDQDVLAVIQGSVAVNLVGMYKGLGGGWQTRIGRDFVPPETQRVMAERTDWGGFLAEPAKAVTETETQSESSWRRPDW